MKGKFTLLSCIACLVLVTTVIPPLPHQNGGSIYQPTGQHGGM